MLNWKRPWNQFLETARLQYLDSLAQVEAGLNCVRLRVQPYLENMEFILAEDHHCAEGLWFHITIMPPIPGIIPQLFDI
jgi:hypothetical protein